MPGSTVTGQRLPVGGQRRDVGGVDVVEVVGAGDFAGHAADRQAVAAVRGDREFEHDVVEAEHLGGGVPGSAVPGGSTRMPEWSVPRLSSAVEQIMPSEVRP